MKTSNNRLKLMILVLIAALAVLYRTMFVVPEENSMVTTDNMIAIARVEATLIELEQINLDIQVFADPVFTSLQSIEVPLVSVPVGKTNPFAPVFNQGR